MENNSVKNIPNEPGKDFDANNPFIFNEMVFERKRLLNQLRLSNQLLKKCNNEEEFKQFAELHELCVQGISLLYDPETMGLLDEFTRLNVDVPNILKQLVDTNIDSPKFGLLENKKYKVLNNLLTDDYIFRLKTGQIDSVFETDQDYNNKEKWKEFVDKKLEEYTNLKSQGYYTGTLDNYFQEGIVATISLTRFHKDKKEFTTSSESEKIHNVQSYADAELNAIMNGSANQTLTAYGASVINQILAESKTSVNGDDTNHFGGAKK